MFNLKSIFNKRDKNTVFHEFFQKRIDSLIDEIQDMKETNEKTINLIMAMSRLLAIKPFVLKREMLKTSNNKKYLEIMFKPND